MKEKNTKRNKKEKRYPLKEFLEDLDEVLEELKGNWKSSYEMDPRDKVKDPAEIERRDKERQEKDRNAGSVFIRDTEGKKLEIKVHYTDNMGYHLGLTGMHIERITDIKGLDKLHHLEDLELGGNKISQIKGLDSLKNLRRLNLFSNKIKKIHGFDKLTNLEKLNLDYNQIIDIEGLDNLKNLRSLSLSENKITEIKRLKSLKSLMCLYLSKNQIREFKGLEGSSLTDLDLSYNQITNMQGLCNMKYLEGLDLCGNRISEIDGLDGCPNLVYLNLEGNELPNSSDNRIYHAECKEDREFLRSLADTVGLA